MECIQCDFCQTPIFPHWLLALARRARYSAKECVHDELAAVTTNTELLHLQLLDPVLYGISRGELLFVAAT